MRAVRVPMNSRKRKSEQIVFGGYSHTVQAQEGSIWDQRNISGRDFPYLRPIRTRPVWETACNHGIFAHNALGWVNGTELWYDGHLVGHVQDNDKQFAVMGNRIVIWPDKAVLNASYKRLGVYGSVSALRQAVPHPKEFDAYGIGHAAPYDLYAWDGKDWKFYAKELEPMERIRSFTGVQFRSGTYHGVKADSNTMVFRENVEKLGFKEGDAVTIEGCSKHPENNKTAIIREIEGTEIRFYEWAFKLDGDTGNVAYTEPGTITLSRKVPELDVICACDNRLWGAKDDTIYASKLGDPMNFNVFDGLTTDSWFQATGTAGAFTGCIPYLGQPIFFKENFIFKIYGANAENFQPSRSATMGVKRGAANSLAIAGETLYYLGTNGLVAYNGGIPQSAAEPFGTVRYRAATAGSDGRRLYLSMEQETGEREVFCLDTATGLLCKEDDTKILNWCCYDGRLYGRRTDGRAEIFNQDEGECPDSMVEFGDITEGTMDRKGIIRLQMRVLMQEQATLTISIQYDSDGQWRPIRTLTATRKMSFYFPVRIARCDHWRLRLEGTGYWELQQMGKEFFIGSGVH